MRAKNHRDGDIICRVCVQMFDAIRRLCASKGNSKRNGVAAVSEWREGMAGIPDVRENHIIRSQAMQATEK